MDILQNGGPAPTGKWRHIVPDYRLYTIGGDGRLLNVAERPAVTILRFWTQLANRWNEAVELAARDRASGGGVVLWR